MKAVYVHNGGSLYYLNETTELIKAGDVVSFGDHIGVAGNDIEPGGTGSIHVTGVFRIPKKSGEAIEMGSDVFWGSDGITAVSAEGLPKAGYAAAKASENESDILVRVG